MPVTIDKKTYVTKKEMKELRKKMEDQKRVLDNFSFCFAAPIALAFSHGERVVRHKGQIFPSFRIRYPENLTEESVQSVLSNLEVVEDRILDIKRAMTNYLCLRKEVEETIVLEDHTTQEKTKCPICYEDVVSPVFYKCFCHGFCESCKRRCSETDPRCPLCRS